MRPQKPTPGGPKARTLVIGGEPYVIEFNTNAVWHLERTFGLPLHIIEAKLTAEACGYADLQTILWAGLEGARLSYKTRQQPWLIEEVGLLIDRAGGVFAFWDDGAHLRLIIDAMRAMKPVKRAEPTGEGNEPSAADSGGEGDSTVRPTTPTA